MINIGAVISGRYEIIEKVGTGGMADVYRAKDHRLNRYVAVKILKNEYSEDAKFVTKFRQEAQAIACLSHPNIVGVYDVGQEQDMHYIVMEFVDGITLKKYIEQKGKLSVRQLELDSRLQMVWRLRMPIILFTVILNLRIY